MNSTSRYQLVKWQWFIIGPLVHIPLISNIQYLRHKGTQQNEPVGSGHFQGCQVSGRPNLFYKSLYDPKPILWVAIWCIKKRRSKKEISNNWFFKSTKPLLNCIMLLKTAIFCNVIIACFVCLGIDISKQNGRWVKRKE